MPDLIQTYREMVTSLRAIEPTLAASYLAQYEPSPRPPRTPGEPRSTSHTIPDPTADTVMDERRLALRAEVAATINGLEVVQSILDDAKIRLDNALEQWEGIDE